MCFCVIFWVQPNQCGHTQLEELILPIFVNWNIGHNTINNGVCSYFINTVYKYWIVHWKCTMKLQYVLMKNIEIYSGLHKIYIKIKIKWKNLFRKTFWTLKVSELSAHIFWPLDIILIFMYEKWMDGWMDAEIRLAHWQAKQRVLPIGDERFDSPVVSKIWTCHPIPPTSCMSKVIKNRWLAKSLWTWL